MGVLLIGTLDTKGEEVDYVKQLIRSANIDVIVADAGVLGDHQWQADVSARELYGLAGEELSRLQSQKDRGRAITAAAQGAAKLAKQLHAKGKLDGVFGLGGSAGTTIATAAMRELPVGMPKVMVSTLASGQVRHYVGTRDIAMFNSVVDLAGLNRISRTVLGNAVAALVGMVQSKSPSAVSADSDKPVIVASMFGVTTPSVEAAKKVFETAGYEVIVFHATGIGGQAMEGLIRDRIVAGVFDLTTTELADELVGGVLSAGPDRLTAAAITGTPQVVSVGALDMVNFGPKDSIPEKFAGRRFYEHNPTVTLMRTTPEENDELGKAIAEKVCAASGPTRVILPLKGVSAIDQDGQPFWWPEADQALFQSIRNWIYPSELLIEIDSHINDPVFAETAAQELLSLIQK